ncbi:cobyrinic acid a,c-diamide synthase [Hyphomicrobium methylovorum]|uniref:cobyrinate a,c-diamide synthase n=1 Tax=Hyphomicrobium methylovorum TaxID=84 RepID=UPI0015E7C334|nr:cobyrinate a,c-diamide synthase [Hyphomicrobium methylovorum]MBA2126755.1 cobyrinic acid a,c-diamide synthase [Hyphomicrobium methylovorum]
MTHALTLPPGLIVGAPRSGSGKTTLTLGLLRALHRRGLSVQPFKCGPDYIDPAFHERAVARTSYNVDSWAMRWPLAATLMSKAAEGADLCIAEALMGFFDGVSLPGQWGNGASADLAAATGWPVILILDVSGQSQTAAAVARGFQGLREGVTIAGVVLNRTGSERHIRLASDAMAAVGLPVVGALPRTPTIILPERHLGLVQAEETEALEARLDALADFVEAHVDVGRLAGLALSGTVTVEAPPAVRPPGQRIALARDAAFSFVYPHLIKVWRSAGAEIIPFSPLADEAPDPTADVVWLPGGYPELHAGALAAASNFKAGMRRFAETRPVHGECGGYMALGAGLVDADGARHEMLGLLGLETSFAVRKMTLGYRKARLLAACALGEAGRSFAGHEFHYASVTSSTDEELFALTDSDGRAVPSGSSRRGLVTGSFFHLIDNAAL